MRSCSYLIAWFHVYPEHIEEPMYQKPPGGAKTFPSTFWPSNCWGMLGPIHDATPHRASWSPGALYNNPITGLLNSVDLQLLYFGAVLSLQGLLGIRTEHRINAGHNKNWQSLSCNALTGCRFRFIFGLKMKKVLFSDQRCIETTPFWNKNVHTDRYWKLHRSMIVCFCPRSKG